MKKFNLSLRKITIIIVIFLILALLYNYWISSLVHTIKVYKSATKVCMQFLEKKYDIPPLTKFLYNHPVPIYGKPINHYKIIGTIEVQTYFGGMRIHVFRCDLHYTEPNRYKWVVDNGVIK